MEILFIGVASSETVLRESAEEYYNGVFTVRPQQYFDYALVEALSKDHNVKAISEPPVASYPESRCLIYKHKNEHVSDTLNLSYLSVINLPLVKTLIISIWIFLHALWFASTNRRNNAKILTGYISSYIAIPVLIVAKIFRIPLFTMVPDLPEYVGGYGSIKNPLKRLAIKAFASMTYLIEDKYDGYIFFTNSMNEVINRKNKPFTVVEGMVKEDIHNASIPISKEVLPTVMYAGTLHVKFGIRSLVEAFMTEEMQKIILWIFGNGDYLDEILLIVNDYPNIIYKGALSRSEILEFERRATLLINPRPCNEEYTKFSFPSKTLEYMASGTPLLTTRLEGIPIDYKDYLYWIDEESPCGIARKINTIISQPEYTMNLFGASARAFVLKNKTSNRQIKKVIELLNGEIR